MLPGQMDGLRLRLNKLFWCPKCPSLWRLNELWCALPLGSPKAEKSKQTYLIPNLPPRRFTVLSCLWTATTGCSDTETGLFDDVQHHQVPFIDIWLKKLDASELKIRALLKNLENTVLWLKCAWYPCSLLRHGWFYLVWQCFVEWLWVRHSFLGLLCYFPGGL